MSQRNPTILIVDDEPQQRTLLTSFVESLGCEACSAESGEQALELVNARPIHMVLLDVRLPGIDGLETLTQIRASHTSLPVLLLTAYADLRQAVVAMKSGADDYLAKPVDLEELRAVITDHLQLGASASTQKRDLPPLPENVVFQSPAARRVLEQVAVVAPSDAPVLIRGETGTGKEVVARLIHAWSRRHDGPMVATNCAATPEALFESELFGHTKGAFTGAVESRHGVFRTASGGTLFLDEIGELPLALQPKLLRVMETNEVTPVGSDSTLEVDTRLVVATHRDLEEEIRQQRFREDLYYRINVVEILLEPLRRRTDDILPMARSYAQQFAGGPVRFSPRAAQCLLVYGWPGNVRELRNAIQRACLLCRGDIILPEHFPPKIAAVNTLAEQSDGSDGRLSQVERATILATLEECNHNKTKTAKQLGISRRALIYKLHEIEDAQQGHSPVREPKKGQDS
jgi:DNA-binding NtrC family response regulator